MEVKTIRANENIRLSKLLLKNVSMLSFATLQKLLRNKDIKVNGKRINSDGQVEIGDEITIYMPEIKNEIKLNIIYQDDNIMIINKPFGFEVAKKDKSTPSAITVEELTNSRPCHRLDRNTEGLVVLARNAQSESELLSAFSKREIEKFYTALVFGTFTNKEDTLKAKLLKDSENALVKISQDEGEEIITKYKVLEEFTPFSLIKVELVTGKTHQIRAHMNYVCHPVVGDKKYCGKNNFKMTEFFFKQNKGYCLTCSEVTFHFAKGKKLAYLDGKTFTVEPSWKDSKSLLK